MEKKRALRLAVCFCLVACICLIVFITSFRLNSFGKGFYSAEFDKYNVYGRFYGQDIDKINQEVLDYIRGRGDSLDADFFEKGEVDHLKDVKDVIVKIGVFYYWIWLSSAVMIIVLWNIDRKSFVKNIRNALFYSGISVISLAIVILALILLNFDIGFTLFHKVFFPQGGWLFNASDKIVNLYPPGLFYDIAKNIFFSVLIYGSLLILIGALNHKNQRKSTTTHGKS